jgi:hypothetical protein
LGLQDNRVGIDEKQVLVFRLSNPRAFAIAALVLSAVVLLTYQWEESANYGAKWEKFRLVAEQLKSERFLFLTQSGHYAAMTDKEAERLLVESVERMIRGTDIAYFSLLVDPGKRIEKRLETTPTGDPTTPRG